MGDTETLVIGAAVLFLAGSIKGFIGLGLPTVAMALLTLALEPRAAVSLILVPMLVSNLWQMIRGGPVASVIRRHWRFAILLALSVAITLWLSRDTGDRVLGFVLGSVVIVFAATGWWKLVPEIPQAGSGRVETAAALLTGVVAGLSAGWVPLAMYLFARRVSPQEFVQATGFLVSVGSVPMLMGYLALGHADGQSTVMSAILVLPTLAGFTLGEGLRRRVDPEVFRKALLITFAGLGLNLVFRSVSGGW
ncbi:sulfite exporter TauE/SafE family protein [Ruegeria marina]|uniref:Probable membrane transporter protein n=1 Tax=Ruegeria marina TaxID=639004 RepID=A0A1G6QNV6_9RHOB|nr:sulfite exporter TauE/SafE family protein [Ruegeria marina]SDC94003.1 hypothetical protein SAMN04488239_104185 [Ruegeria marina]